MDISKVLTISTAHITEETDRKLQDNSELNLMDLSVYEKGEYGYWIYIDPLDILMCHANIPEDLLNCIKFARQNDCRWLCLDCDGEVVPELPTYEW